jgi:hypothetical protein
MHTLQRHIEKKLVTVGMLEKLAVEDLNRAKQ